MADERERSASRRLGVGAVVVLILAGLAITVGIGMARGAGSAGTAIVTPSASAAGEPTDGAVYVHVAGAVVTPGLYRLSVGDRVVDAVGAAGGFAGDADRAAVNLARTVDDGEQLVVPVVGAAPPEPPAGAAGAGGAAGGVIDLNAADAAALDTLPRIGPALAERIVTWREENGRFTSVDDLLSVPGIGEKIVDGLRDLVRA
ncbi:ComEA family DNA-binding protein [Microbacterium sp. P06]|uniref:ComEA family DNA-binding protein n=1 Tax=Microbacterium sp. P06 TaxID=3366949 RepID=UPI003747176D